MRPRFSTWLAVAALVLASPPVAAAQTTERTLLHTELAYVGPFGAASDEALGPGGSALIGVFHSLHPAVVIGAQARASLSLRDGDQGLELQRRDALYTLTGVLRIRLMGTPHDPARGTGPFLEAGGGVGISEALTPWPVLELAVGWGLAAGDVDVVPTLRYRQVLGDGDAIVLGGQVMAGLGFTFGDAR